MYTEPLSHLLPNICSSWQHRYQLTNKDQAGDSQLWPSNKKQAGIPPSFCGVKLEAVPTQRDGRAPSGRTRQLSYIDRCCSTLPLSRPEGYLQSTRPLDTAGLLHLTSSARHHRPLASHAPTPGQTASPLYTQGPSTALPFSTVHRQ